MKHRNTMRTENYIKKSIKWHKYPEIAGNWSFENVCFFIRERQKAITPIFYILVNWTHAATSLRTA